MILKNHYLILPAIAVAFASCSVPKAETSESLSNEAISLENMDTTVSPGQDFFQYVNGGWLKNTEIPKEENSWGSFNELLNNNNEILLEVLNEAAENEVYKIGSDERKAADFYKTGMDSLKAEELGFKPLQPYVDKIQGMKNKGDLQKVIAEIHSLGSSPFFNFFIDQDLKKSDQNIFYFYQGGLGMPNREYYTKTDQESKDIRQEYLKHVAKMFEINGDQAETAKKKADAIMKIENQLALASKLPAELRDWSKAYNKKSIEEVNKLAPELNWQQFLTDLGRSDLDTVIVAQPDFIKEVNRVLQSYSLEDLKTYLHWNLISEAAPYLHHEVVNESFRFNGTVLKGTESMKPRWKRVMAKTDNALGEALGKLYVAKAFPPEAKESALEMVENIKVAFKDRINNLDWMSDSTKAQALNKLATFTVKIGYPDKWRDYSDLDVGTESYVQNALNAYKFELKRQLNKIGKPVDKNEWLMSPPTVNAYYNPTNNEIVFPAGILQPPFYDYQADAAVNYGGIGAVIGHEITHGFDDQGSQFDAEGNMNNWWTETDNEAFKSKTHLVVNQFNKYQVTDSLFVNGELTLGENIADLGGLAVAYDGLQKHLQKEGRPGEIDGFTPEQRFFISWAQIWRNKMRPESERNQVLTDPHSPARFRVNGPVSNLSEFYSAFDVQPGDPMMQQDSVRAKIW